MPDPTIEPREHYVYALYREDGVTPFYIGMGKGDRWTHHETRWRYERNGHKRNIIKKMIEDGLRIPKAKIAEALTRAEASQFEIELIAQYGRHPNGPLANHTDGGEGASAISPESMEKRKASLRRAWQNPETRARMSEAQRTRKRAPRSEETKAKLSATLKGSDAWKKVNPERRAEIQRMMVERAREVRLEKRRANPRYEEDHAARRSAYFKERWPAIKAERQRKAEEDPGYIECRRAYDRALYAKRKAKRGAH